MPGTPRVEDLIVALQVPDAAAAVARIAQQLVPRQTSPADTIVAMAWATPDLVRTMERVAAPFVPADRDRLLGAITTYVNIGPVKLLLEQPEVEAGLAAYLSRYGEGLAALYLDRPRFMPPSGPSGRPAKSLGTPLGRRGWLLPHDWPWGPFVIALDASR